MIVTIIGQTDVVLSLNETGIQIQGKQAAEGVDLDTMSKEAEIRSLQNSGLIEVIVEGEDIEDTPSVPPVSKKEEPNVDNTPDENEGDEGDTPDTDGTPENEAKTKVIPKPALPEPKSDAQRSAEAEAETQKEGSRVVVSTGDQIVETKMVKSAVGEVTDSEATQASLEAMEKLEAEENEEEIEDKPPVKEEDLPPEEQMGRGAVVMEEGSEKKIDLVNSAVPGSDNARERDPFVDKADKVESKDKNEDSKIEDEPTVVVESKPSEEKSEGKSEDSVEDIFTPDDEDEEKDSFIEW